MSIQKQFEKFYNNILLTPNQKEDAKIKYDGVCKKLHEYYYPTITYTGNTKLLIGSYGKHTHIRPARDIDVIFIMPPEKFEQYNDNSSNCQAQLLQDVKKILEEKYPNTPIKAYGKVVVLEFSDTKHDVELLPAWENNDKTFKIPNSENGGSWEYWNPREEIAKIKNQNSKTGQTKKIIRMMKKWTEKCSIKIKSYQIENKALNFLTYYINQNQADSILIKDFIKYLYDAETNNDIKSHFKTALFRAEKACNFESEEKIAEATNEWKKIFGDDFPANKKNELSFYIPKPIINPPKPWLSN